MQTITLCLVFCGYLFEDYYGVSNSMLFQHRKTNDKIALFYINKKRLFNGRKNHNFNLK